VGWICRRWASVERVLLVEKREAGSVDQGSLDEKAWESFCSSVGNLVVCVLWYAFVSAEDST